MRFTDSLKPNLHTFKQACIRTIFQDFHIAINAFIDRDRIPLMKKVVECTRLRTRMFGFLNVIFL